MNLGACARVLGLLLVCAIVLSGCGGTAPAPPSTGPGTDSVAAVTLDDHGHPVGLHNFHKWTDRIGAGAQPDGDEAFRNLAALGYKVVVSVDGARPDLENAQKYGLRYVHVPIGYDGIDEEQRLQIVKAAQTAEGPVYFHCHHGKHRGPAAVAIACIATESFTHAQAAELMKTSGTDPKYKGLYKAAETATAPSAQALAACAPLTSYRPPDGLVSVMVAVDGHFERIDESRQVKWAVPPKHPDVDPPHEVRMLWEQYRELARRDEAKAHGDKFMKYLKEAEDAAAALETAIRANDAKAAEDAFARSKKACSSCHKDYRDN